jgi:hypothetical protein
MVFSNAGSGLGAQECLQQRWLEGWIVTAAANGVQWGSHSALVAAVLNFLELDTDLEVLGFRRNMGLIEDKVWRTFLLQLPITLLTAWRSSGGSSCR